MTGIKPTQRKYFLYLAVTFIVSLGFAAAVLAQSPQDRIRPLIGGIQIQNDGWWDDAIGSIGFSGYYSSMYVDGRYLYEYGFVTAGHFTSVGESVYQPTISGDNYVGYTSSVGWLSDCAFIYTEMTFDPPTTVAPRIFSFRSNTNYDYVVGYRTRSQMYVDEPIQKMGRTAGYTEGYIRIFWEGWLDGWFNPVLADYYSAGGDSGGTVYQLQQQAGQAGPWPAIVYGIHSGIYVIYEGPTWRVFTPTDDILTDLGVTVYEEG